jgi:hypothetical protein
MADSPLDIFENEAAPPPDRTVCRGIGAILGLAAVIAGTVILVGSAAVGAIVGLVWVATQPAYVEVVAFTQLSCRVTTHDVVVSATIARGPDYASDFAVGLIGWEPETLYFDSDPSVEDAGVELDDVVSFSGPAERVDEITGVRMGIWRGEPGYAQTVPLTVTLTEGGCVASTPLTGS